jgi:hypothetical protein
VDFQILVKHFQVAAGPEGQNLFHLRIHDITYFEHVIKKWYRGCGVRFRENHSPLPTVRNL